MRIVAADDEEMMLEDLVSYIKEAAPNAEVHGFSRPKGVLEFVEKTPCDIAFLDIEMGSMNGIELAKKIKKLLPKINIIFVTGYEQYAKDAIRLRASGYVTKPVRLADIKEELDNLRNPVEEKEEKEFVVKCFGTFDVFVGGESLRFERRKTKEMLAYLIDRRGCSVSSGELCAVLWENAEDDKKTSHYLQVLKKDLTVSLERVGMKKIFVHSRNQYAIDTSRISCDYYDYLDNKAEGVRAYNGEYMAQYSWGEIQNVWIADDKAAKN